MDNLCNWLLNVTTWKEVKSIKLAIIFKYLVNIFTLITQNHINWPVSTVLLVVNWLMTVIMVDSIKLFQFVQKFHKFIGIYPSERNQTKCSINTTNTIFLISFAQFLLSSIAFLAFDADSMLGYGFGFFVLISIVVGNIIYLLFIWKLHATLKFIESGQGFIEKSM